MRSIGEFEDYCEARRRLKFHLLSRAPFAVVRVSLVHGGEVY